MSTPAAPGRPATGPSLAPEHDGAARDHAVPAFGQHARFSLGLEEDVMLLDRATLEPVHAAGAMLVRLEGDARYRREPLASRVEIVTPVSGNAQAAGLHLARARLDLSRAFEPEDVLMAAAGTHPFAPPSRPAERCEPGLGEQVPLPRGDVPAALHVHVGLGPAERCLSVYNAARSYLPEIAALASNSPYWHGADTGLACAPRPRHGAFDRAGIPPALPGWKDFLDLVEWGRTGGLLAEATPPSWDLRPHLRLGTLELRSPDAQTRVEEAAAIAAVFQSLVVHLAERIDRGRAPEVHETVRIEENAWRASRHGVQGKMVDLDTGRTESTRSRIGRMLERIGAVADDLGNLDALHTAHALLADNGTDRQRYVCAERGLYGLTRWLAETTIESAKECLSRRA